MKASKRIILMILMFSFGLAHGMDKIIVGDYNPNWVFPDTLENAQILENSKPIGRLIMPSKGYAACTAFLISEDIIMTNQHCIRSEKDAPDAYVFFNHERNLEREKFICDEFISNNPDLDYALLKCKGLPGSIYGMVKLSEKVPHHDMEIYLVHQNCDYYEDKECKRDKKVSSGFLTDILDIKIYHDADTLGGSSGAPIFCADTHEVIGIHNKGSGHEEINGRRNGRGKINLGIKMSQIVAEVKVIIPDIF